MNIRTVIRFTWIVVCCGLPLFKGESEELASSTHLRHPLRMAWSNQGQSQVVVANSNSGSLSLVDLNTRRVLSEQSIAESISDMLIPDSLDQILICHIPFAKEESKTHLMLKLLSPLTEITLLNLPIFPLKITEFGI